MYGKLRKNIGFSLLPWAFIFLFEPSYALIDPLPDFIGYFIICFAIINMADVNARVREAFIGFRRALFISIAKYASIYLLNKFFIGAEQTVSLLLLTFVFSFCELIVLIPTYKSLFDGFLTLAMLYGGDAVYYSKKQGKANITERAFRFSALFLIIQKSMATLPEFTTLNSNDFYEFVKLLRIFSIIIVLPFGIAWLVNLNRYCKSIKADDKYITAITDLYCEKAGANPHFFTVRVLSTALLTLSISFVLSLDVYSNHQNLLPDFLFYGAVISAMIFLRKYSKHWKAVSVCSLLGMGASIAFQVTNNYFLNNFTLSEIAKEINAYNAYYTAFALRILEAIISLGVTVTLTAFLWDIFISHTDMARDELKREHKNLKKTFIKSTIFMWLSGGLTAASSIFYGYSQPFYYSEWYYSYSLLFSVVLNVIFAYAAWRFLDNIKYCIKRRYSLYL